MFIQTKIILSVDECQMTQLNLKADYDAPYSLCLIVIAVNKVYGNGNSRNCFDNKPSDKSNKKVNWILCFKLKSLGWKMQTRLL